MMNHPNGSNGKTHPSPSPSEEREALSPRKILNSDNALYELVALSMFQRHTETQAVRKTLWNYFSMTTLGISLDKLMARVKDSNLEECQFNRSCRGKEFVDAWAGIFDPSGKKRPVEYAKKAVETVTRSFLSNADAPSILFMGPLIAEVYGVVVVYYIIDNRGKTDRSDPHRIWYPPGHNHGNTQGIRHIHLAREKNMGSYYLLVSANLQPCPVPTHVKGSISSESFKRDSPNDSDEIYRNALYLLNAFDPVAKKHLSIAPFIHPLLSAIPSVQNCHHLRVDARCRQPNLVYLIRPATENPLGKIFIFATRTISGEKRAVLIGAGGTDFVSPRIVIYMTDEEIVIVPSTDEPAAVKQFISEWRCPVDSHR